MNIGGIMYTEHRQGRPEFVLVDGIGEKLIIPFRSIIKGINDRNVRKVEKKIKSSISFRVFKLFKALASLHLV
ncbi:PhoP regulatory network YrbL family protein [Psychrobacter sp. DAB_AL43B]|uniref:PhoP regulatory network YrbL family protein n=1 Tax=Psychrobacter sp. DAB_AL43B TaxID=1028416 RepID=UPI0009C38BA6|nr:PhoP regulatory network YrbL family protein [Psychrobacter sp. DAB_AL43B]SLJ84843.1 hypothetical protein DABAL43B_1648 [Psychrobacter sp. DAB_AL43B]